MRKISMMFCCIILSTAAFAQIPNQGFELWTSIGSYETPDDWGTMNDVTSASDVFTATKGIPGNPGSYYLKLTSQAMSKAIINGIAVSGELNTNTLQPVSGFAYALRPASLTGKWQHMIYGSSQGSIAAVLTKWNTGLMKRDTIATALTTLSGMAMSWASFTINFTYNSIEFPDSCIIFLKASGNTPTQNDYLWVDNLQLTGSVSGANENKIPVTNLSIFPNPAGNSVQFQSAYIAAPGDVLTIMDSKGSVVFRQALEAAVPVNLSVSGLFDGVYHCQIINRYGISISTQKLVVAGNR